MKNKKINSEKVKAILKKSVDVFCYIITAISLTIGIAMGVNACSGSNEPKRIDPQQAEQTSKNVYNAVDIDDYRVYVSRYTGVQDVDFSSLRASFNVPTTLTPTQQQQIYTGVNLDNEAYVYANSTMYTIRRIYLDFRSLPVDSNATQYEYCLRSVYVLALDGSWVGLYDRIDQYATPTDRGQFNSARLILSPSEIDKEPVNSLFVESSKASFTFNADFNYNAPFGLQYNAVYGTPPSSGWFDGGGDSMSYRLYDVGWFWSNGRLFNQIQWWAIKGNGVSVVIDDQISTLQYDGNYVYTFMYYRNSTDPEPDLTSVLVNSRDSVPYNGGNSRYYANSSTWIVPAYRNITLLSTPSDEIIDLLGSFNNNNQYDTGSLSVGGDMGDVFTLIATSFTGLLPILTLQILPSVTIGTLLFVPLVAMLVFAIIRIIKK